MFQLTATTTKSEGIINVPVLDIMTNEQTAEAILRRFPKRYNSKLVLRIDEVKEYVKTLLNEPTRVFVNPCYDVPQMSEAFILSFDFD